MTDRPRPADTSPRSARWRARLSTAAAALLLTVGLVVAGSAPVAQAQGILPESKPKASVVKDKRAVNLGVKFSTAKDGSIVALQFYRSSKQKKAYVGSLWSSKGKLLARVTFPKSAKQGWQTATLSKPVKVKKGTTYVASYLASDGRFAVTRGGYAKKRVANGITVAKNGGVFSYSKKSKRPFSSGRGSNYLVDVVFEAAAPTTPPGTPAPSPNPTTPPPSTPPTTPPSTPPATGPLTKAELQKATDARVLFVHQSVGRNVLDGMDDLRSDLRVSDPPSVDLSRGSLPRTGPVLADAPAGKNGDPMAKIAAFKRYLDAGAGGGVEIALLKFCYSDIREAKGPGFSSVDDLFNAYIKTMTDLERAYPKVKFIYATVPVENFEIKGSKRPDIPQANANRALFNTKLRAYARDNGKTLWDVARLQSTRPDGTRYLTRYNGSSHEGLAELYTRDGGHLDDRSGLGRRVVASELVRLIAHLS